MMAGDSIEALLDRVGFRIGLPVEVIASTIDSSGRPNAAPMGIVRVDRLLLVMRPYKETRTCSNLLETRVATLNVTSDVKLFFATAFKVGRVEELFEERYEGAPPLKGVDAFVRVVLERVEDEGGRVAAYLRPIEVRILRPWPRAVSRCDAALIEAMIHATRVRVFLERGDYGRVEELRGLIRHYYRLVERICPRKPYLEIMRRLAEFSGTSI